MTEETLPSSAEICTDVQVKNAFADSNGTCGEDGRIASPTRAEGCSSVVTKADARPSSRGQPPSLFASTRMLQLHALNDSVLATEDVRTATATASASGDLRGGAHDALITACKFHSEDELACIGRLGAPHADGTLGRSWPLNTTMVARFDRASDRPEGGRS